MERKVKKLLTVLLISAITVGTYPSSNAIAANQTGNMTEREKQQYVESHKSISFENIDISYDKKTEDISLKPEKNLSSEEKREAEENIDKVEGMMERYDENLEELIGEAVDDKDTELQGISYTECPLYLNKDGQLDRVTKMSDDEDADDENDGEIGGIISTPGVAGSSIYPYASGKNTAGKKYYFSLVTAVRMTKKADSNGKRTYDCITTGTWSKNSALGGAKYPASGNDYVIQATPKSMSRISDSMSVTYNNGLKAKNGTHYSRMNGGTNYVKYSVVDDPVGTNQIKKCVLTTTCKGKKMSDRTINSYYVHTWASLSLKISVTGNTEKEVSLTITPSIKEKSWKVYSYVTFDF